jgi:hypothetical protein
MSFLDKARHAAEQARQSAGEKLAQATSPESQAQMRKTAGEAGGQLRSAAGQAKRGLVTVVERIDPGILADLIIKATALQEKANGHLRAKGSAYRVAEITITASLPPQVGFAISRIGDPEAEEPIQAVVESTALLEKTATAEVELISLAGETDATEEVGRPEIED